MHWDVINRKVSGELPKCSLCSYTTDQMAKFHMDVGYSWICFNCAIHVKDCMNKWKGIPDRETYIPTSNH